MLNVYEQHSRRKLIATILSIIVIAGVVVFADHIKNTNPAAGSTLTQTQSSSPTNPTTTSTPSSANPTTGPTNSSIYKDGSFAATSDYSVPHGSESIQVSLTLKGGVITDASIQNSEGNPESASYQQDFTSTYKNYVVGKKISGLRLGIVAGASDTTQGFDDALSQIASKAQA